MIYERDSKKPIYVSTSVFRACLVLAKMQTSEGKPFTADEIADSILRQYVEMKYPAILEHQKEVAKMEEKLLKSLTT